MSIVRTFRSGSRLTFGVGNYEADGELGSINSGEIESETVVPGASVTMAVAPDFHKLRQSLGLPSEAQIGDYLRLRRIQLPKTSNPDEGIYAVLGYGFGKFIRQDSLRGGVVVSSRYMKPIATAEEGVLGAECDARFQRQQLAGKPTVQ